MASLADLHRAVQATLASTRLGKPVFVRYLLQGADQADAIAPKLAQAAAVVRDWLKQPLERVHAVGSVAAGQVSLTLQFKEGATALVSYAKTRPLGDGLDLMVIGNQGAIYHDAGSADLGDEPAALPDDKPDPIILATIERALSSGKPEVLK
jgi:hypothetical protein